MLSLKIISIPFLCSAILILAIGFIVLLKNQKAKERVPFIFLCLSLGAWMLFAGFALNGENKLWTELKNSAIVSSLLLQIYFFNCAFNLKRHNWIFLSLLYYGAVMVSWEFYLPPDFRHHALFVGFWAASATLSAWTILRKITTEKFSDNALAYNKACYILLSNAMILAGAAFFLMPKKFSFPDGSFLVMGAVLINYFAVLHPRTLPDFTLFARKILNVLSIILAAIVSAALARRAYFLLQLFSFPGSRWIYAATLTAAVLQFLKFIYAPLTDQFHQIFFQDYHSIQEKLKELDYKITRSESREALNHYLEEIFVSILKCSGATFFLWDKAKDAYILQANYGNSNFAIVQMEPNYILPKSLSKKDYLLINDNLHMEVLTQENRDLLSVFYHNHMNLCVPIVSGAIHFSSNPEHMALPFKKENNKYLVGFFIFKEKLSHLPYSLEEVKMLVDCANCTRIALQSLRLNQEPQPLLANPLMDYFPSSIAHEVLSQVQGAKTWLGQKRYAVILMFDLRGFTSMFDDNKAEEVMGWLTEYFKEMAETILSFGGTIDKFMGDGGLAVFGLDNAGTNPEYHAVQCAIEMQKSLHTLNEKRLSRRLKLLHMGIAIAAGEVMAGNIGSEKHMEYTVIGDPVNLAARLQAIARPGQIIATENIKEKIPNKIKFKEATAVQIRGKSSRVKIIEIEIDKDRDHLKTPPKIVPAHPAHLPNKAVGY